MSLTDPPFAFVLSVDDVGDLFVLAGTRFQVGHSAAPEPDLGFFGDIDGSHGVIELRDSFHGGAEWCLSVVQGAPDIEVDGKQLGAVDGARALHDGDRVRFGEAAEFTCRRSDPSSATMVLELEGRTNAEGARRVVLLAPGVAGRMRLGPRLRRHVVVLGISTDIALVAHLIPDAVPTLTVSCAAGVRVGGGDPGEDVIMDLPLASRVDLALGAAPNRMPPFGLALRPTAQRPSTR